MSFELIVCDASLAYLKSLWKKCAFPVFHELLFDLLTNNLENDDFVKWLNKNLEIRTHLLRDNIIKYKNNEFIETRGREENARTDKLYMMHRLRTLFHQLMAEIGERRLLSQKDVVLPVSDLANQEVLIEESIKKCSLKKASRSEVKRSLVLKEWLRHYQTGVYRKNLKVKGQ